MKNSELSGHLFALLCVIVWGTTFLVSKTLMLVVTPIQLMWMRFVLAYLALWILHPHWHLIPREEPRFLLISFFGNTLYFLCENTSLRLSQVSNVSILVSTAPIITALILLTVKGEKLTRRQSLGFVIAFCGVVLVVFNGVFMLQLRPAGDLLALAAAAAWAVYGILVRSFTEKYNSFLVTRKLMFYGILTSIPLLAADSTPFNFSSLLTAGNLSGLLFLGLIGSALCYVMWNGAIRRLGPLKANFYIYGVPLVTLLAGAVALHETVTPMGMAGIVLVVVGMVLSNLKSQQSEIK